MPKNLFQDMVKVKRERQEEARRATAQAPERAAPERLVRQKPVESAKEVEAEETEEREAREVREIRAEKEKIKPPKKKRGKRRYSLWFAALLSVGVLLFSLSFLFSKAEIMVEPKVKDVTLNEGLYAVKDGSASELPFDLMSIEGEAEKTVPTTGTEDIARKAEGSAIIYNTYSAAAQPLAIDTRLEGSNGKIYKTTTKTTVPGMKDGKPGAVEVKIYGSEAGVEYNSGPLDFKIIGWKGDPKYEKFYGRSKGSITGGLKGTFPAVSDEEKEAITVDLRQALQDKLVKKATDQIPAGFILFKNATFLNIDEENFNAGAKGSDLTVKFKGTMYGILFEETKLTKQIVADNVEKYDGSEVYIPNIRDLIFSLPAQAGFTTFSALENINFRLTGPAKLVWKVDTAKLTADILGKSKKDFASVLSKYPNITSANSIVSPFWKMSFPKKAKDIKVIVNYPK